MKVEKAPGYDWTVAYQFDGEEREEMAVFGQIKIEDAVEEARYSLDGFNNVNVGTYAILAVTRDEQ